MYNYIYIKLYIIIVNYIQIRFHQMHSCDFIILHGFMPRQCHFTPRFQLVHWSMHIQTFMVTGKEIFTGTKEIDSQRISYTYSYKCTPTRTLWNVTGHSMISEQHTVYMNVQDYNSSSRKHIRMQTRICMRHTSCSFSGNHLHVCKSRLSDILDRPPIRPFTCPSKYACKDGAWIHADNTSHADMSPWRNADGRTDRPTQVQHHENTGADTHRLTT